jgi:type IV pilus assembly protein PilN
MPHINLLPWREALRAERQRQFVFVAVAAVIFMGLVVVMVHIEVSGQISTQNDRNAFLQNTIKRVEKEIEEIRTLKEDKKALLARMDVIQRLQHSRPEIVHLFEEIAKATPKGVYLINTKRESSMLEIEGVANSNDSVSQFMRQLDQSPWFNAPRLQIIDSSKTDYPNQSWFKLQVPQTEQNDVKEPEKGKKT